MAATTGFDVVFWKGRILRQQGGMDVMGAAVVRRKKGVFNYYLYNELSF